MRHRPRSGHGSCRWAVTAPAGTAGTASITAGPRARPASTRSGSTSRSAIADLDVLPLRVDAGLARGPAVIEAVPAVPAGAVTAHLHEPWPDLGRWRIDRHRHRGAALAAGDQVCARIGG